MLITERVAAPHRGKTLEVVVGSVGITQQQGSKKLHNFLDGFQKSESLARARRKQGVGRLLVSLIRSTDLTSPVLGTGIPTA